MNLKHCERVSWKKWNVNFVFLASTLDLVAVPVQVSDGWWCYFEYFEWSVKGAFSLAAIALAFGRALWMWPGTLIAMFHSWPVCHSAIFLWLRLGLGRPWPRYWVFTEFCRHHDLLSIEFDEE